MLSQLIINKPEEPLQFLIDFLRKDVNCKLNFDILKIYFNFSKAPAILILGPPASGKKTLSQLLSKKIGSVLLNQNSLIESLSNNLKNEFSEKIKKKVIFDTKFLQFFLIKKLIFF